MSETKDPGVANRINELMVYYRLSKHAMSVKIGVSPQTISNIFSGIHGVGSKILMGIELAFPEVDMGYIISGKGTLVRQEKEKKKPFDSIIILHEITEKIQELWDMHETLEKRVLILERGTKQDR